MDEKILELLQKMDTRLNKIEHDIKDLKIGQIETNNRLDNIEKKQDILYNQSIVTAEEITSIKDNFDVIDIKLNTIETRVIKINRKLNGATDQVARNMEQLEEIKIKLQ
ncbi:hypothetical protein LA791_016035 [Clostridioides difficile]|uniref:hypothetical protein n=1 Tax=Clostridioides difficile TaxID=1496 RepID=UPI00038D43F6|nr:hypothetical protein [Clostridioides difficile]EQE72039.1 hypothetical protein QCQ_3949 [Clostridioides difficile CD49]MBH6986077.1 hypothetical protein [Clostridioides difficile]MBY2040361.1 hypothetical protein [Clostridioides difficile]MBY2786396.1 hypothetical protein [Clostridioides difficile]MBZ0525138.1 hypothetical protein [Clostridioides difficile]